MYKVSRYFFIKRDCTAVTGLLKLTAALNAVLKNLKDLLGGIHNRRRLNRGGRGGQPKLDYSSKLLVINESIKGGGGSKNRKNESTSIMDDP